MPFSRRNTIIFQRVSVAAAYEKLCDDVLDDFQLLYHFMAALSLWNTQQARIDLRSIASDGTGLYTQPLEHDEKANYLQNI